ncbi:hypothetical protein AGR1C_pAt20146 [Agrobacterium fabacearum TT111]|nr:hypothetical protein AGR1C_pAt20146 [Agrobacterium fabacearum TT111]
MEASGVIDATVIETALATMDGIDRSVIAARIGLAGGALFGNQRFLPLATFTALLDVAAEEHAIPCLDFMSESCLKSMAWGTYQSSSARPARWVRRSKNSPAIFLCCRAIPALL